MSFQKFALCWALVSAAVLKPVGAAPTASPSFSETVKAVLCENYGCSEFFMQQTGLRRLADGIGPRKTDRTLKQIRNDAHFFARHVLSSESGSTRTQMYRHVVLKISPQDKLTTFSRIETSQGSYYGEVPLETRGKSVIDLKHGEGGQLRINGRPLVSQDLRAAHQATQSLIFEGVLEAPKNEFNTATDAVLINQLLLK